MHMPSIALACLIVLALTGTALTLRMIRPRRRGQAIFNGGILLALGLAAACALPILSRLPWAKLADGASGQAIEALHFLEVTYVILTL